MGSGQEEDERPLPGPSIEVLRKRIEAESRRAMEMALETLRRTADEPKRFEPPQRAG